MGEHLADAPVRDVLGRAGVERGDGGLGVLGEPDGGDQDARVGVGDPPVGDEPRPVRGRQLGHRRADTFAHLAPLGATGTRSGSGK